MIKHEGALGDCGFTIPALSSLREKYDQIYQTCTINGFNALSGTGLIDRFIVKPHDFPKWALEKQRQWLIEQTEDLDFQDRLSFHKVVPGVYLFHEGDPNFNRPVQWKRENAKGVNFFDEMSKRAGTLDAIGKRPVTKLSEDERIWLENFRQRYRIPKHAFLLGWVFAGSSPIKWYPHFDKVIQYNIMARYEHVYVVGLGDTRKLISWDPKFHGGRFINFHGTFRQSYILTSILDLLVSPETGIYVFSQAYETPKILLATHTDGTHITCGGETQILLPDCECAPCYNIVWDCKRHPDGNYPLCIGSIRPETIIGSIERVINGKNNHGKHN